MVHSRTVTAAATPTAETPHRPSSPDPFADNITPAPGTNPFASPYTSRPESSRGSSSALPPIAPANRYFHSRRVRKGEIEKPWLQKKDPREKWVTIIPLIGLFCGLGIAAFLIWDGVQTVVTHNYCPVLIMDDFSGGLDPSIWTKEVECGGYGNGQFEMTTNSEANSYIQNAMLYITPTLQQESLIATDSVINLTATGQCTSTSISNCVAVTNSTNSTIVNPVLSARLNTKKGAVIKYGRVEVEAKLPAGDWLWPAIWMLPVVDIYGPWPASGEIDILESRGNNYTDSQGGNDIASSALHWGPDSANDEWWRTNVKRQALHTTYSSKFNTFGLEWSEKYLFTYINSRLLQVLYTKFDKPMWEMGDFPQADSNGTKLTDPWSWTGRDNTPFDQNFYLLINLAVGATNGWFQDGLDGKPWVDTSETAMTEFWNAKDQWYPTWKDGGQMIIKSVKIWQQEGYNGC